MLPPTMTNANTKMKAERVRKGWNQQTLGYHAKVAVSDISKYENGRAIPYDGQAKRLAKVLGLTVQELQEPAGEAVSA